tara:strand:- start:388 stop:843 length:456 start_codon:yes stop_codon:yes gene_type:complete
MDDLAQAVIEHLQVHDQESPFVAITTLRNGHTNVCNHVLVTPVTKNGTTSFNVQTASWVLYRHELTSDGGKITRDWVPKDVCNFATAAHVARYLLLTANQNDRGLDKRSVRLSIGPFGTKLFNDLGMDLSSQEDISGLLDMIGSMRPTVKL